MSNLFGHARSNDNSRNVPDGDTVGSYTSYLDAQKAVDYLADQQFQVNLVSIVGNDLKMVEQVTGKLSYPRVALTGALQGIWFGLFVGLLLSFFSPTPSGFGMVPVSMMIGAGFWMLFGIISYAAQRGKRDFTSTSQVIASSYHVIVAREASAEAWRLLQNLPMSHGAGPQSSAHYPGRNLPGQNGYSQQGLHDQAPGGQAPDAQGPQTYAGQGPVAAPRRGSYPDLPDGRPQYGVRIDPENPDNIHSPESNRPGRP